MQLPLKTNETLTFLLQQKLAIVISLHFGTRVDSGIFGKKRLNARGFAQEYLRSCSGYGPVEASNDMASLLVVLEKKIFCLGVQVFL